MFNLEFRILDKLGRTKKTFHGGVFRTEEELNKAKERILTENVKHKIAFNVYLLDKPIFS